MRGESADERSFGQPVLERLERRRHQYAAIKRPKSAGITADQVPRLKLKWAFGYPTGVSAFGQPAVASGRVFVGSDIGYVYSLDAKTGCVYWSYQAKGNVRGGPSVGPVKGHGATKYAVFFGDAHANVYAVDAQTGQELWTKKVDDHFVARITASPKLYRRLSICSGVVVGRIRRRESRLSVLHLARQRREVERQHRRRRSGRRTWFPRRPSPRG